MGEIEEHIDNWIELTDSAGRQERYVESPVTFGRAGDFVLADDLELHRVCGQLVCRTGIWWLDNTGGRLAIRIECIGTQGWVVVKPGVSVPLMGAETVLSLTTSAGVYLARLRQGAWPDPSEVAGRSGPATADPEPIRLNEEQRQLIAGLAEPRLKGLSRAALPANKHVASRLGWSRKKFDGKLDYLCKQLDERGVPGMRGSTADLARQRREVLVEYATLTDLVGVRDLELLPELEAVVGVRPEE